jgi:hypothetical protein
MAKKATGKAKTGGKGGAKSRALTVRGADRRQRGERRSSESAGDALIKLLQSPLVAELVAVAATAALGALAQEGVSGKGSGGKRAGNAVKRAGKAAAKAIGDRLGTEIDEIKKAATAKRGAKA